jgi:hypothetical protein
MSRGGRRRYVLKRLREAGDVFDAILKDGDRDPIGFDQSGRLMKDLRLAADGLPGGSFDRQAAELGPHR